ncbi:hypothetical protein [Thalassovita aquimarina]|uniref:Uncharacterized protein n=1 Tax=Thalassovita aquimarina TaxID=2785917 RepID=A0ABS5HSH7_9RHOB|nr:hypothetical protein [Thalassovita aquimarina]MBR9651932.1 hypothetical protein [Thalassovita aquimarina]
MKMDIIGSASAGFFAVAGSWLAAHGSSVTMLIMAVLGAFLSVMDLDEWGWRKAVTLALFNTLVGTFGGPILLFFVGMSLSQMPPGALVLIPFLMGWTSHSFFAELRDPIAKMLARTVGGRGQ